MIAEKKTNAAVSLSKTKALLRPVEGMAHWVAVFSGYSLLVLAFAIAVEIVGRKLFAFSFQGIDDIGGYVLAFVAMAGAGCGVVSKTHVRVDVFQTRFPVSVQSFLNVFAAVGMALFACFAAWRGCTVLGESIEFGSRATNPLQTPLWIPQTVWLMGLFLFAGLSCFLAGHAVYLWYKRSPLLNTLYGPLSSDHELDEELAALEERKKGEVSV